MVGTDQWDASVPRYVDFFIVHGFKDGRVLMSCSLDRAGDRRAGSESTALQSPHRCPIGDRVQGPIDVELESPDGVRQADFRASR